MYSRDEIRPNVYVTAIHHKDDIWLSYDEFKVMMDDEMINDIPKSELITHEKLLDKLKIKYADVPKMDNTNRKTKFINTKVIKTIVDNLNAKDAMIESSDTTESINSSLVKSPSSNNIDNIINMFKYNDKEVTVLNVNGEFWFKAKEVAEILGYTKYNQAIQVNIKESQKKSYKELISSSSLYLGSLTKRMHSQTLFINEQGLYKLIFKSNKPEAEAFTDWVTEIVMQVRRTGSYSIHPIEKLEFRSFCEDNLITTYEGRNVIYVGFVGIYNNEHIFKYGISRRIFQRTVEEHTKTFGTFQLLYVKETDNKEHIEDAFGKELALRNLYRKLKINNTLQTELFTITIKHNIDSIINILDNLITKLLLPSTREKNELTTSYENRIQHLETENSRLITDNNYYKELIKQQQNTILTLAYKRATGS